MFKKCIECNKNFARIGGDLCNRCMRSEHIEQMKTRVSTKRWEGGEFKEGDILTWAEIKEFEEKDLGERFLSGMLCPKLKNYFIITANFSKDAKYADKERGNDIIYEGHNNFDIYPEDKQKTVDQPTGPNCNNGKFIQAVKIFKEKRDVRQVKVYEKKETNVWIYRGFYELVDYWQENCKKQSNRKVCKFKLVQKLDT